MTKYERLGGLCFSDTPPTFLYLKSGKYYGRYALAEWLLAIEKRESIRTQYRRMQPVLAPFTRVLRTCRQVRESHTTPKHLTFLDFWKLGMDIVGHECFDFHSTNTASAASVLDLPPKEPDSVVEQIASASYENQRLLGLMVVLYHPVFGVPMCNLFGIAWHSLSELSPHRQEVAIGLFCAHKPI